MLNNLIEMVKNNEEENLFKNCANRCLQVLSVIYEIEKSLNGLLWESDFRYYENSMGILYERYCYGMSIIGNQFHSKFKDLYGQKDTFDAEIMYLSILNKCADLIFKSETNLAGFQNGTILYYSEDFDDDYDDFWDEHYEVINLIFSALDTFDSIEWTWEFGFHPKDKENDDSDLQTYNKDFLHIYRIIRMGGKVDVEKFLITTKRKYLPLIINSFYKEPVNDIFIKTKKWWQFWK